MGKSFHDDLFKTELYIILIALKTLGIMQEVSIFKILFDFIIEWIDLSDEYEAITRFHSFTMRQNNPLNGL